MFNLFSPIGYNTAVDSITLPYFTGYAFGAPWYCGNGCSPYLSPWGGFNSVFNFFPLQNYYNPYFDCNPRKVYSSAGSSSVNSSTSQNTQTISKNENKSSENKNTSIKGEFLNVAKKYENANEADNSHLNFCINPTCKRDDPKNQEWSTDFVTKRSL